MLVSFISRGKMEMSRKGMKLMKKRMLKFLQRTHYLVLSREGDEVFFFLKMESYNFECSNEIYLKPVVGFKLH